MMKYITVCLLALLVTTVACKKKKETLPTTMSVVVNKDTVWTTTNVVTSNENTGTVYIKGTRSDGGGSMDITLSNYKNSKGTFLVDYRGTGGNITGNTGMYRDGSNSIMARTGKIVVTEVTETLIKGTFDFFYLQTNIKGSFTAPAH